MEEIVWCRLSKLYSDLLRTTSCPHLHMPASQEGGDETSVGAVRSLQIGDQMLFEKLVALDDEEHIM